MFAECAKNQRVKKNIARNCAKQIPVPTWAFLLSAGERQECAKHKLSWETKSLNWHTFRTTETHAQIAHTHNTQHTRKTSGHDAYAMDKIWINIKPILSRIRNQNEPASLLTLTIEKKMEEKSQHQHHWNHWERGGALANINSITNHTQPHSFTFPRLPTD